MNLTFFIVKNNDPGQTADDSYQQINVASFFGFGFKIIRLLMFYGLLPAGNHEGY